MMKLEGALFPWRFRVVLGLLGVMVARLLAHHRPASGRP
jgi:cell division protein FtsI (penicillin-binding protein 3)